VRPYKNVYPELEHWMQKTRTRPDEMATMLYITPLAMANRLRGTTDFGPLEVEKLVKITGIPEAMLLYRKEDER